MNVNMPDLPAGFRWKVEEDTYGDVVVRLQQQYSTRIKKFWKISERTSWKTVQSMDATNYMQVTLPHDLPVKVEQTARKLLKTYEDKVEADRVRNSILGVYNDQEVRDDL